MLRSGLSSIAVHPKLKARTKDPRFSWQNKAYDTARAIVDKSQAHGFFGINMASTGLGKTFANARIMYGLSNPRQGCRFSIALGLRTLTLQTGQALTELMHLDADDLAVLIGSQSVKTLFHLGQKDSDLLQQQKPDSGSTSQKPLVG